MPDLVNVGINYPGADGKEVRAEIGEVVSDIPEQFRDELIAAGIITPVEEPAPAKKKGGK